MVLKSFDFRSSFLMPSMRNPSDSVLDIVSRQTCTGKKNHFFWSTSTDCTKLTMYRGFVTPLARCSSSVGAFGSIWIIFSYMSWIKTRISAFQTNKRDPANSLFSVSVSLWLLTVLLRDKSEHLFCSPLHNMACWNHSTDLEVGGIELKWNKTTVKHALRIAKYFFSYSLLRRRCRLPWNRARMDVARPSWGEWSSFLPLAKVFSTQYPAQSPLWSCPGGRRAAPTGTSVCFCRFGRTVSTGRCCGVSAIRWLTKERNQTLSVCRSWPVANDLLT